MSKSKRLRAENSTTGLSLCSQRIGNFARAPIGNVSVTHVEGDHDACGVIGRKLDGSAEESMIVVIRRYETRSYEGKKNVHINHFN